MAKRQRIKSPTRADENINSAAGDRPQSVQGIRLTSHIALGLLGAITVYLGYHPSDSIAVETGDAVWFCFAAILLWCLCTTQSFSSKTNATKTNLTSRLVISLPWMIAGWVAVSAIANSQDGNLRAATNETWVWVAAACLFHAVRTQVTSIQARREFIGLLLAIAGGLAVHGMHQYTISLPQNRADYRANPEMILELAGIDAPEGSAERMIFENRLMDGGPSATFALANTLAGYLLVGSVLSGCLLMMSWPKQNLKIRISLAMLMLLCVSSLLATRSRTATIAMLLAFGALLVTQIGLVRRRRQVLIVGISLLMGIAITGVAYLGLYGNREWFEQAPASLAFRFQYWRSTWQIVSDSPWFGCGPGQFQAIYERYRELSASEQIAEPHNFLMETLATGGFPACLMLITLGWLILLRSLENDTHNKADHAAIAESIETQAVSDLPRVGETQGNNLGRSIRLGAITGLAFVWVSGLMALSLPDVEASLFVIPIGIALIVLLTPVMQKLSEREISRSLLIAMGSLLLHLSMSGGWTVPGLAVLIWVGFGILSSRFESANPPTESASNNVSVSKHVSQAHTFKTAARLIVPAAVLTAFVLITLRPAVNQKRHLAAISNAQYFNNTQELERRLIEFKSNERWSPEPVIWLSDSYRWQIIQNAKPSRGDRTKRWKETLDQIRQRSGNDAGIERIIGIQAIHVYQRWGEEEMLQIAKEAFDRAAILSPADQWIAAQRSLIYQKLNQSTEAQNIARQALALSKLGGNIERDLTRQLIYPLEVIGKAAENGPLRKDASTLLAEQVGVGQE
ncbi:MAG: O-antigen ligase family protein [Rubripirellula sp.]|nr:O-antigen ligase family protein [Rubripirellula sp.]